MFIYIFDVSIWQIEPLTLKKNLLHEKSAPAFIKYIFSLHYFMQVMGESSRGHCEGKLQFLLLASGQPSKCI